MKGTRRILAVLLALTLIISLSACASAPKGSPVPSSQENSGTQQSQEPSSDVQEEPTALPETLPEDTTELTVALRVTSPEETTWDNAYPVGELDYSTQADVDVCRQWLYDLRAGDITGMYGETMPLDHYWTGEMSLEDSRRIVDLLRSAAPDLAPLASGNPPTGGGWVVAIHTGEEAVRFGFNGEWFTFVRDGKGRILDGTAAQQSLYEIDGLLWKYSSTSVSTAEPPAVQSPADEPSAAGRYFSGDVRAIYALDSKNYVAAEVKDGYASSKAIWDGLKNRASSDGKASGYGYLIITGEGKEYVYLNDSDGDQALNKYCQAALKNGPLHPSWLIHMAPERLIRVDVMGTDGYIADKEKMATMANAIKAEVTVGPEAFVYDGADEITSTEDQYFCRLTFDSRVYYNLIGYVGRSYLSVYASDLDKYVVYQMDDGVVSKLMAIAEKDEPSANP